MMRIVFVAVAISMILTTGLANAQLPAEVAPTEQDCEQMEISNRLYNPVTINISYDKATVRTPEVIVSKSNPEAVIPIQILENNANIFTNATGRFVAKLDLVYADQLDRPRIVSYNVISGRSGIEFERGTWMHEGMGFCKVITFTITEEPHIPTIEEMTLLAKEVTAVELKKNREEQMKTNDLIAIQVLVIVGLIAVTILTKIIDILVKKKDMVTATTLINDLATAKKQLYESRKDLKNSIEYNETMNDYERKKSRIFIEDEINHLAKELFRAVIHLQNNINQNVRDLAVEFDRSIRSKKPMNFVPKPIELKLSERTKPVEKISDVPETVTDGLNRMFEKIPDVPLIKQIKDRVLQKQQKDPESFEEFFEFYNKNNSREELVRIYETKLAQLKDNIMDKKLHNEVNALNIVLRRRE